MTYTRDAFLDGRITIGEWTYGIPKILIGCPGARVSIGKFCSIAEEVIILAGVNHRDDWITTYPFSSRHMRADWPEAMGRPGHPKIESVVIGHDVWLGVRSTIMPGVTIGNGAIVGAGSVVTKDVNPYAIVVGAPTRQLRLRFHEEVIVELLRMAWWDWPVEKIKRNMKWLLSDKIEGWKI